VSKKQNYSDGTYSGPGSQHTNIEQGYVLGLMEVKFSTIHSPELFWQHLGTSHFVKHVRYAFLHYWSLPLLDLYGVMLTYYVTIVTV
jgi:hypothetical protein